MLRWHRGWPIIHLYVHLHDCNDVTSMYIYVYITGTDKKATAMLCDYFPEHLSHNTIIMCTKPSSYIVRIYITQTHTYIL